MNKDNNPPTSLRSSVWGLSGEAVPRSISAYTIYRKLLLLICPHATVDQIILGMIWGLDLGPQA